MNKFDKCHSDCEELVGRFFFSFTEGGITYGPINNLRGMYSIGFDDLVESTSRERFRKSAMQTIWVGVNK